MSIYALIDKVRVCVLRLAMWTWIESQREADLHLA